MSTQNIKNFLKKNWTSKVHALDFRSMALYRVGLGFLLILDLIGRLSDLKAHYTDFGVVPRAPYLENFVNDYYLSLHLAGGHYGWQLVLFSIAFVSSLCFMLGYRTKLSTFITWALLISLQSRNHIILNGGDVFLRNIMFWNLFLPLGAAFSIDAALCKEKLKGYLYWSIPALCILLQISFLYICTGLLKTGSEWWPDGTAAYFALSLDQFATPIGKWMLNFPNFLKFSSWGTVWWEKLGTLFFFLPLFHAKARVFAILAYMSMHFFFDLSMRIGLFPWINIATLTILLPSAFWVFAEKLFPSKNSESLTIYYDGDCNFCLKLVLIIKQFLLINHVPHKKAQEHSEILSEMQKQNSWVLQTSEGTLVKFKAFLRLYQSSRLYIPGFARLFSMNILLKIGTKLYELVANNRSTLSRLTKKFFPFTEKIKVRSSALASTLAIVFIAYIATWNYSHFKWNNFKLSFWSKLPGRILRIDQKWNMFSAYPLKDDGWFVIDGKLIDGRPVDVWRKTIGPVSYEKPDYVAGMYTNARWRKYLMNIRKKKNSDYRLYYGKYLCRNWNTRKHLKRVDKLASFQIYYMLERTPPPGGAFKYDKIKLWGHNCYKKSKK